MFVSYLFREVLWLYLQEIFSSLYMEGTSNESRFDSHHKAEVECEATYTCDLPFFQLQKYRKGELTN